MLSSSMCQILSTVSLVVLKRGSYAYFSKMATIRVLSGGWPMSGWQRGSPLFVEGVLLRSTCTRVKHGARAAQFKVGLEEISGYYRGKVAKPMKGSPFLIIIRENSSLLLFHSKCRAC